MNYCRVTRKLMRCIYSMSFICVFCMVSKASSASSFDPATIMAAKESLPVITGTLADVNAVLKNATNLLYFPRSAIKTGLSVLPGPTLGSALSDFNKGVVGTANLTEQSLALPFNTLNRTLGRVGKLSPLSLLK